MANAIENNDVVINYDDDLTIFLNSIALPPPMEDIQQNEKTVVVVVVVEEENIQKRQQYSVEPIKRYSKKIRRL